MVPRANNQAINNSRREVKGDKGRCQRLLLPHSTNKKNRNRIRRIISRMIYAASLKESKETEEQRKRVYNLKEQLKHFVARPRQRKQVTVRRREKPVRPQVSAHRRERGKGRKCIKYPKPWSPDTPVCTKSKRGKMKYNVGTGRGQRRSRSLKHLISSERERGQEKLQGGYSVSCHHNPWIFRRLYQGQISCNQEVKSST